jgi:hypothetical protein
MALIGVKGFGALPKYCGVLMLVFFVSGACSNIAFVIACRLVIADIHQPTHSTVPLAAALALLLLAAHAL